MALRKISQKNYEEEIARGFNILTGGELTSGLTLIKNDQQPFLKKPPQPWNQINNAAEKENTQTKVE